MSASIRIKIVGGTRIDEAYYDCENVSVHLGGISVETDFNGISMLYHHQPIKEWKDEYTSRLSGSSHGPTHKERQ